MGRVLLKVCSVIQSGDRCSVLISVLHRLSFSETAGLSSTSHWNARICDLDYVVLYSVGKTSLMNQYVNKRFSNQYKATIGADLCV